MVSDHLPLDPAPDCLNPDDLTLVVIDVGVLGKSRHDCLGIKGINGTDVFGNDAREFLGHGVFLDGTAGWPGTIILSATVGGESIAALRLDSPGGGECTLGAACPPRSPSAISRAPPI